MKKLDRFILTSFVGPFFGILILVVFILMMQFLWLYIDELVGKGLGLKIIVEFLMWGSCTMLPISLPLATLLASVMTLGGMSENNELIAMKSAGISLKRIMAPLFVAALLVSVGAFFAANKLVPLAFNKIYTLREDIRNTKDEIKIPTGIFYDGITGYVLRVESRDEDSGMMYGIQVYDHTGNKGNTSEIFADSAMIRMSRTKDYLTFDLYSGISYQETNSMRYRDTTLQLSRSDFSAQKMIIPLENYSFQKRDSASYGSQIKSMDMVRLAHGRDSAARELDSVLTVQKRSFRTGRTLTYANQLDTAVRFGGTTPMDYSQMGSWRSTVDETRALSNAITQANDMANQLKSNSSEIYADKWTIRRSWVEWLKKIAQSLACLLMFLIGAPLGAFVNKKGGLGASAIVAVLFFVLYWVVDITGIKLANDAAVSPWAGVFVSTVVLLPIGLYLSWKAVHDSAVLRTESFGAWWRKFKSKIRSMFRKTRIVYMGTPEFAVAPLEALVDAGYKVVGVVTVADKPSGRGLKVNSSPVKLYAQEHGIPVLQPLKLKDPDFLAALAAWKADLFVVVAFRMLPEVVWTMPPLGTFNLHAALLPQYRGAAPINWAVINGERISGVTTFMIDHNIDTGGIMLRHEVRLGEKDTAGDLHDRLMPVGAELVLQTVQGIIEKNIETRVQRSFIQGSEVLKSAPKLTRELCHIDWDAPQREVYNLIRGLSPYPTAFTELVRGEEQPQQLKIFFAEPFEGPVPEGAVPGTVLSDGKTYLAIVCKDGALALKDLQLAGKKRMEVQAFLAGFREPASWHATKGTSSAEIAKTREP